MSELRKITQEKLDEILRLHKLWLESDFLDGEKAYLGYCDLSNLDFNEIDLSSIVFKCSNLRNCMLVNSNLSDADLSGCDLSNANLTYSNLTNVNLIGANLSNTNLYKTDLFYAKIDNMISIGNLGEYNRTVYYFYKNDRVICGCFDDTLEEFEKAIKEKYKEKSNYYNVIEMFKAIKNKYEK